MPELLIPMLGYFLGAIPFGYILVKATTGGDIREAGSGNIGATNVFRKSRTVGAVTFLLDAGKGYFAVEAAGWLGGDIRWQAAAAVAAILGHVFTVFLRFKGGKGVATALGVLLALNLWLGLACLATWLLVALVFRLSSLAALLAALATPVYAFLLGMPRECFHYSFAIPIFEDGTKVRRV